MKSGVSDGLHGGFISLDRTFHELSFESGVGDDVDLTRLMGASDTLRWEDLLREYRVVLLSEAGSGKTEEIRHGTSAKMPRLDLVSRR